MEEAHHIVVDALERAGIVLPPGIAAVPDFGPAAIISVCSQVLGLIHGESYKQVYLPGSVPQSMAVRFRACTELAEEVKQLGYRRDLSFHQFLYPNEVDVHRLLRFLLEKLSQSPPSTSTRRKPQLVTLHAKSRQRLASSPKKNESVESTEGVKPQLSGRDQVLQLEKELQELQEQVLQIEEDEKEKSDLTRLYEEEVQKTKSLADEVSLLELAVDLIENESLSPESVLSDLEAMMQGRKGLETPEEGTSTATESEGFDAAKSIENDRLIALLRRRKEELSYLSSQAQNLQKQAPRSSYIRRITELVKNSRKQDADITKIIAETRALQRDNNATQERLRRIHMLVDELVFRDAKKDPQCRLAYRLLSGMHECFSELMEKVFEIDKVDRETAEVQASFEALQKEPVDIEKVQADLNSIWLEKASQRL